MTILDNTGESELVQLVNTIQELAEQIAQNKSLSATLHASASVVKVCVPFCSLCRFSPVVEPGCSRPDGLCAEEVRQNRRSTVHI